MKGEGCRVMRVCLSASLTSPAHSAPCPPSLNEVGGIFLCPRKPTTLAGSETFFPLSLAIDSTHSIFGVILTVLEQTTDTPTLRRQTK